MSELITSRKLSSNCSDSRLKFEVEQPSGSAVAIRYLCLDDKRAYELGITCNTCQFWFERKSGANASISLEQLAERLNVGVRSLDDSVLQAVVNSLPSGEYTALLSRIRPKLTAPSEVEDYFCREQVELWGVDAFWGLPYNPRTEYYRTGTKLFEDDKKLFEFVVPMFPHGWLKAEIVEQYEKSIGSGQQPTAVAIGLLDVKSPAVFEDEHHPAVVEHWCLPSFLIDGHHKVYAASKLGAEMTLLTFIATGGGTAEAAQIEMLPNLL